MNEFNKKIITIVVVFTILSTSFSPIFARKAEAQWVDIVQNVKEMGLDGLAWIIVNTIIKKVSSGTIKWINSGFKGKPAYVTDPETFFMGVGKDVSGEFIFRNKNLDFLCGDLGLKVRLALYDTHYNQNNTRWRCTVADVGQNFEGLVSDFSGRGGWDNFFQLTQRQQNNPIGAYIMAEGDMTQKMESKINATLQEVNQGSGFMAFKQCVQWADETTVAENGGKPICVREETATPGSVVQDKLNSVLDQSESRLVAADEFNEMIAAIITQLTEKLVGMGTKGLKGLSGGDPANNNQSFADQMNTDASTEDYFDNPPDTSVLDEPIPDPGSGGTLMPLDRDCSSVDLTTLNSMAQDEASRSGMSFDDALRNLDCDPVGVIN